MKLRLEENTLRLRLSAKEVAEFRRSGRLETVVALGLGATDKLTYALERTATVSGSKPQLKHSNGHITVLLPAPLADA
jgi:hypothetical protein